jgi:hypothetical protein
MAQTSGLSCLTIGALSAGVAAGLPDCALVCSGLTHMRPDAEEADDHDRSRHCVRGSVIVPPRRHTGPSATAKHGTGLAKTAPAECTRPLSG